MEGGAKSQGGPKIRPSRVFRDKLGRFYITVKYGDKVHKMYLNLKAKTLKDAQREVISSLKTVSLSKKLPNKRGRFVKSDARSKAQIANELRAERFRQEAERNKLVGAFKREKNEKKRDEIKEKISEKNAVIKRISRDSALVNMGENKNALRVLDSLIEEIEKHLHSKQDSDFIIDLLNLPEPSSGEDEPTSDEDGSVAVHEELEDSEPDISEESEDEKKHPPPLQTALRRPVPIRPPNRRGKGFVSSQTAITDLDREMEAGYDHRARAGYKAGRGYKFDAATGRRYRSIIRHGLNQLFAQPEQTAVVGGKHKKGIKGGFSFYYDDWPPRVKKLIEKNKDATITKVLVVRAPIQRWIDKFINFVSSNGLDAGKKKYNYTDMFHLYIYFKLSNGASFRIERNHVIEAKEMGEPAHKGETEIMEPTVPSGLTFGQFMTNAADKIGKENLNMYDPGKNNCQVFTRDALAASGLITPEIEKFVMQEGEKIIGEMPSTAQDILRAITDFAHIGTKIKDKIKGWIYGSGSHDATSEKQLPALWNDQLDKFFEKQPKYLGTYTVDEIEHIKIEPGTGFIFNTARSSDKEGEHWVAVYLDPLGASLEYFDPLADPPAKEIKQGLMEMIRKSKLPWLVKLKVNGVKRQSETSETCGYFCLMFLDDRFHGIDFPLASRYGRGPDAKGEDGDENEEQKIKREFSLV